MSKGITGFINRAQAHERKAIEDENKKDEICSGIVDVRVATSAEDAC